MLRRRLIASVVGKVCVAAALVLFSAAADARVSVNGMFSDNAVLQQGIKLPVWGTADNGEKVIISIGDQKVETTAAGGKWRTELAPLKAGGPYTLVIEGPTDRIEAQNVLVGEVWIAGGQSNMQMKVDEAANANDEIKSSENSQIRLITIDRHGSPAPKDDVQGKWVECGPKTVGNFSAVAYFFGRALQKKLNVPVGLINCNLGGTTAERWMSKESLDAETELTDMKRTQGANDLYNGMIHPLIGYGIAGAIWYQGESNADRAYAYRTLFPAMIKDWREEWKQGNFPFLFVQLAPFMQISKNPQESNWAELREAQLLTTQKSPHTAMAVITDVGDEKDIHPKKKQPVGERLAVAARALAYGEKIEYSGPTYESLTISGRDAILHFGHVGGGLVAKGEKLTGFTIAGEDKKFHNADARIEGSTVVVSSSEVEKPVAVRLGWANFPVVNLWNRDDLPASPFRTDDFPVTTQPKGK